MASAPRSPTGRDRPHLLGENDPAPVAIVNPGGASPFLLLGDHAGNRIPGALGDLGLSERERTRHIAWDIGVAALGRRLAGVLDAVFVHQVYSRLVADCNRRPDAPDAMPRESDGTVVPGNSRIDAAERAARYSEVHERYHRAIATLLADRDAAGRPSILVSLHSFTPTMGGVARPWHCGILHDGGDVRFGLACLDALRARGDLVVGDNEPYRMDAVDYTVPRHAYASARCYAEIEVRQDELADAAGVARWTDVLGETLRQAATMLTTP